MVSGGEQEVWKMSDEGVAASGAGLAARLNYLFTHVRPAGEDREYSGREVVAAVNEAGTDLSASHLSQLRRGVKENPTLKVLQAIATFFDVRVAYLLDDPDAVREVEAKVALRTAMQDAQVQDVAHRVAGLDSRQRVAFNELLADIIKARRGPGESREDS